MELESRHSTLYREVLAPTFPPDELVTEQDFLARMADGSLLAHVEPGPDGQPVALAVAERFLGDVLLLSWLAVHPRSRSGGLGGRTLTHALDRWQSELDPRMVLGEVEHPLSTPAHEDHGDPSARLRFYHRFGVRALPVAHVQPSLRPEGSPVENLMLCVFRDRGLPPGDEVEAAPVRGFLADYLDDQPTLRDGLLASLGAGRLLTVGLDAPVDRLPNPPRVPTQSFG